MKKNIAGLVFILCPMLGWGTELQPWYPERSVELQARLDYLYQAFDSVQSSAGNFSYRARDHFLGASVLGSVEGIGAEFEVIASDTKEHSFYPDCFKLTGRYLLSNDSVGDLLSLIAGVSMILPTNEGLNDISSFHHGHFEAEAHLAIGKETVCYDWWSSRYSALVAIGCATDEGSPWARFNINYETNWERSYFLKVFVNTLWGGGGKSIYQHHFKGYGSIDHRSVDVGTQLTYQSESFLTFSLGYAYRVYGHNFPKNVNLVSFNIMYPFAL